MLNKYSAPSNLDFDFANQKNPRENYRVMINTGGITDTGEKYRVIEI